MDREIQAKQAKIDYVQTCANYLLTKTVDARGLTINMNELTKFCQQLRDLTKRIRKLKQNLINSADVRILKNNDRYNCQKVYFNIKFILRSTVLEVYSEILGIVSHQIKQLFDNLCFNQLIN